MSETEKANDIPPFNKFIADENGLTRLRPCFDIISVYATPEGVRLSISQGGVTASVLLSKEEASHIACLLGARHG